MAKRPDKNSRRRYTSCRRVVGPAIFWRRKSRSGGWSGSRTPRR